MGRLLNIHHPRYYFGRIKERIFKSRHMRWILGFRLLHCFGDSHSAAFIFISKQNIFRRTIFKFTVVPGASAMGMVNPNSKTQALETFKRNIEQVNQQDYLLFMLGEVDCGFVIWYRAEKYNLTVDEQLHSSLANYVGFIRQVVNDGYSKVIICSAPLPTIFDGQTWGEVAKARREVRASLRERTQLTQKYNSILRNFCRDMGLIYLDFETEILDPQTLVVKKEFLNKNPLDHHLDSKAISPVLVSKLKELGFR